jgi:hypothetical protein
VSGRITQARFAAAFAVPPELLAELPDPEPPFEQPASRRVEAATTVATPRIDFFKASSPVSLGARPRSGASLDAEGRTHSRQIFRLASETAITIE